MRDGFPLYRSLLSLVLIVVFLLGGTLRYTVFRYHYFARIFSHFIAINAP